MNQWARRLFPVVMVMIIAVVVQAANSKDEHLKLYVNFDKDAVPVVAGDGIELKKAENLRFVEGKSGKAVYFSAASGALSDLVYSTGSVFGGNEWSIAMWLKMDKSGEAVHDGKGASRYIFRTFSTGAWGSGDITALFHSWGGFNFSRFDGNQKEQSCEMGGGSFPAGVWTHVVWSCSGGKARVFINGYEARYTKNSAVEIPAVRQKGIRLGCSYPQGKNFLDGAIDEFKIFDKALTTEEIADVMASGSARSDGPKPVVYFPFENKTTPAGDPVAVTVGADRVVFQPGVIGQGAGFIRYGYDARSVMSVNKLQGITGGDMTVDFFFIPNWDGTDGAVHGLLYAKSGNFSWSLQKSGDKLEFAAGTGETTNRVAVNITDWKKQTPVHIAAGYSSEKREMFLWLNGKKVSSERNFVLGNRAAIGDATLIVGDVAGADQYQKSQAEGVIDELRIFSILLDDAQMKQEMERKNLAASDENKEQQQPIANRPVSASEAKLWDLNGAYKVVAAARTEICLNALWRFQLTGEGKIPQESNWHYLAVPGRYSGYENGQSDHQFLLRNPDLSINKTSLWMGRPNFEFFNSWYERTFKADPSWRGKRVVLRFDELSNTGSGKLYFNGRLIGGLDNSCSYEILLRPEDIRYGGDNHIMLYLFDSGNRWSWRGIKGDVWLKVLPETAIEEPAVSTSVTNNRLQFNVRLNNYSTLSRRVKLEAVVEGDNAPPLLSGELMTLPPGAQTSVVLEQQWKNARLWDYDNPYLYRGSLRLVDEQGKIIDTYPEIKFGFREFRIDGGDYYLNDKKIHLRNHDAWLVSSSDYEWCRQYVKLLKRIGYNSVRTEFNDKDQNMENILRVCDEEGLLLFVNIHGVSQKEFVAWNNPGTRAVLEQKMRSYLVNWRNHPSIVMWYMSVNFLGYGWDYHPLKMADGYQPQFNQEKYLVAMQAVDIMKKYDSSRAWFFQAGGNFGPVINSNAYFCWWPQAERIAWADEWSKYRTKPLHVIETSFPYWQSFFGMDLRFKGSKPLFVVENAARYFGDDAYAGVEKQLLELNSDSRTQSADQLHWAYLSVDRDLDLVGKVKSRLLVDAIWNWRAAGISGICPFADLLYGFKRQSPSPSIHVAYAKNTEVKDFRQPGWHSDIWKSAAHQDIDPARPLPFYDSLKKALTPNLVFFAGDETEPTSQAGNFYAGSPLKKSLVVINDQLEPQRYAISWQLVDDAGKEYAGAKIEQTLEPGAIRRIPITPVAPAVTRNTGFKLVAQVVSPAGVSVDPLPVTVFSSVMVPAGFGRLAVYDPQGLTIKSLRQIKADYVKAQDLSSLEGVNLLLIGREGLDSGFSALAAKLKLAQWLDRGCGNVIVMEQQPETLNMLGLETGRVYAREVFKADENLPMLQSLSFRELSNWQGLGSMAPHRQLPSPSSAEMMSSPFLHWSNLNMVSSYPFRRPSSGNYRPLLVCGKDLIYSPLLEIGCGQGKIVFCQMEVSGRTDEPAAAMLLTGLVRNYSAQNVATEAKLLYLLDEKADALFRSLGFLMQPLSSGGLPDSAVVVATRNLTAAEMSRLTVIARNGGTVIMTQPDRIALDALQIKATPVSISTFAVTAAGRNYFAGLSARDRFFRYPVPVFRLEGKNLQALTAPAFAAEQTVGKGRIIFLLVDYVPLKQAFDQAAKISPDSSNLWAESILDERIYQLWTTLFARLGVQAKSLAARVEKLDALPRVIDLNGEWDFRIDPANNGNSAAAWRLLKVPGYWETQGITQPNPTIAAGSQNGYDGYAWYRKMIVLPPELRGKSLMFHADAIDDFDWVYVNGRQIGHTGEETEGYWNAPRNYLIPAEMTGSGKLELTVKVFDARGQGGMCGNVLLRENKTAMDSFPYYTRPLPGYNTETHIRW